MTQETVDQMAELRRQGVTFKDIAARLGCSERTARRYAGKVERRIALPPTQTPEDPQAMRQDLADWFARAMEFGWGKWPSVAFIDEANRRFGERVTAMNLETLRLLARNPKMVQQLFVEVVGPIRSDYATFESVVHVVTQFPDHRPIFWRPHGAWVGGQDDEAGDP